MDLHSVSSFWNQWYCQICQFFLKGQDARGKKHALVFVFTHPIINAMKTNMIDASIYNLYITIIYIWVIYIYGLYTMYMGYMKAIPVSVASIFRICIPRSVVSMKHPPLDVVSSIIPIISPFTSRYISNITMIPTCIPTIPTELPWHHSTSGRTDSPRGWQAQSPQVQSQRGECRSDGPERRPGAGTNRWVWLRCLRSKPRNKIEQ